MAGKLSHTTMRGGVGKGGNKKLAKGGKLNTRKAKPTSTKK